MMGKVNIEYGWMSKSENLVIASYKNIEWPDLKIPLDLYLVRLKEKQRDNKLNQLLS